MTHENVLASTLLLILLASSFSSVPVEARDIPLVARLTMLDGTLLVMENPEFEYTWSHKDDVRRYYNPPENHVRSKTWYCWGAWRNQSAREPLGRLAEVLLEYQQGDHPTVEVLKLRRLTFVHTDDTKAQLSVPDLMQDICRRGGYTPAEEAPAELRTEAGVPATGMIWSGLDLVGTCRDENGRHACRARLPITGYVNPDDRPKVPRHIKIE